jgi:hypothetical protein
MTATLLSLRPEHQLAFGCALQPGGGVARKPRRPSQFKLVHSAHECDPCLLLQVVIGRAASPHRMHTRRYERPERSQQTLNSPLACQAFPRLNTPDQLPLERSWSEVSRTVIASSTDLHLAIGCRPVLHGLADAQV